MSTYKDLKVWQKSMLLCEEIYLATKRFPKEEQYGLTSQIRRAVIAIPSNIAEGQKRTYKKEFIQFLRISLGSGAELETQLEIAKRVGYLDTKNYNMLINLLGEVMKMLQSLIKSFLL